MINYKFISLPKIYKYLNGNEWLLFTVLFDEWQLMKNEEEYFFRSWNSLKEDTGLSNDGLNRALKGLIEKKFISKKTYEKKTQKSNDYRIEIDYIVSLMPTPKTEKASPKIGVTYSEKQSTSKEKRTKEKINKTIDTIGSSTRNYADKKYEELSLNFSSSEDLSYLDGTGITAENVERLHYWEKVIDDFSNKKFIPVEQCGICVIDNEDLYRMKEYTLSEIEKDEAARPYRKHLEHQLNEVYKKMAA